MDYSSTSSKACNYRKTKHKWDTYRYITLWTSKTWTLNTSPPARPLFVAQLPLEIHVTPSQCKKKVGIAQEGKSPWFSTMMLRSSWIKAWSKVPISFGSFLLQVKSPCQPLWPPWIIHRSRHPFYRTLQMALCWSASSLRLWISCIKMRNSYSRCHREII